MTEEFFTRKDLIKKFDEMKDEYYKVGELLSEIGYYLEGIKKDISELKEELTKGCGWGYKLR